MRDFFTIGGVPSTDFNCYIASANHMDSAERDYIVSDVPGRDGSLVTDNRRFKNVEVKYECYIKSDIEKNARGLRNWLLSLRGYQRIEDTLNDNVFRMGVFKGTFSVDVSDRRGGALAITFDCKPQRFLTTGEEQKTYTSSGMIYNPESCVAKPVIRMYGTGTLTVNGKRIIYSGNTAYVDIDCDLQDAYFITQSMNSYIALPDYDFPSLNPGENEIILGTGVTKVIITPRWWRL